MAQKFLNGIVSESDLTLDDGSGASPKLILKNSSDETWEIFNGTHGVLNFYENSDLRLSFAQGGEATFLAPIIANGNITSQTAGGASLNLRRDDTSVSGTNTLGSIKFQADDPTDGTFTNGAAILTKSDGSWGANSYPAQLLFQTRNTSDGLVTALTLAKDQSATFAGTVTASAFYGDGSNLTGILTNPLNSDLTINSEHLILKGSSPEFYFHTTGNHVNWLVAAQENVNGAFEIGHSSATATTLDQDASNYTRALTLHPTTGATFAGKITSGNDIVNATTGVYTWAGDTDTYIQRSAGNEITFKTGASNALVLDSLQNATFSGDVNVNNASTRIISLNYEDSVNSIISHSGTNFGLESLNVRGDNIYFYTDYDASTPKGNLTLTLDTYHNATFAGTITAAGGSSNNNDDANILTLNASEHARLLVDTSSTSGHRATLALESNGSELTLSNTGSASELTSVGNLTVTSSTTTFTGNVTASSGTGHFSIVNASAYQLNGTYIVDSSRNLVNISSLRFGSSDAFIDTASTTSATATTVVASVAHGTYNAAFFDFVIKNGTNVRAGTVYACHNGASTPLVEFAETSTVDLGDTSDVTLNVVISGTNMILQAVTTSSTWTIKSLIRAI